MALHLITDCVIYRIVMMTFDERGNKITRYKLRDYDAKLIDFRNTKFNEVY